jgi:hypothetical protein
MLIIDKSHGEIAALPSVARNELSLRGGAERADAAISLFRSRNEN